MLDEARMGRYNDASEAACAWPAVADAVYGSGRAIAVRQPAPEPEPYARLCAMCWQAKPLETIVVKHGKPALICEDCVADHDWSHYRFDPLDNIYYALAAR